MCENCLVVNGIADEMLALVPLLKSDRTDEMVEAGIAAIPSLRETGYTVEDFHKMSINDLAGLIAIRAARACEVIDGMPCSMVLGEWGGMALQGEISNSPFAAFLMLFGDEEGEG